jgi:hypothetical protein
MIIPSKEEMMAGLNFAREFLRKQEVAKMTHVTKDGRRIDVKAMGDAHLVRTILFIIRRMAEAKDALLARQDRFKKAIGEDSVDEDEAESYVKRAMETLPEYVFEATIRGLELRMVTASLQAVIGRGTAIPIMAFTGGERYDVRLIPEMDECPENDEAKLGS